MANAQMAELQRKQEEQLTAHFESVESAKWKTYVDFTFAYEVDIDFHELDLYLTKLAQELKQETRK